MNVVADANEAQFVVGLHAKLRECLGEHCFSERCVSFVDIISRKKFIKSLFSLGEYVLLLLLEFQTKIRSLGTKDKLIETTNSNGSLKPHLLLFDPSLFLEDNLIMRCIDMR